MEKRKMAWMILTALAISLVIVAGAMTGTVQRERSHAQENVTEVTTAEGQYRIQITDGKLALYRTGSSVPYQKLDMPLSLLSEYDLEQLESGITVGTEAELRQLVEGPDFLTTKNGQPKLPAETPCVFIFG